MLRQAAILAREAGRFVYQRPDSISIDGVTYTLEHTDRIPPEYKGPSSMDGLEPLTPVLKARTRAENVNMIGNSMQKLAYGIGFFSAASFVSNFYDCGVTYKYQRTKLASLKYAKMNMLTMKYCVQGSHLTLSA